jgi:hypothetical protein
VLIGGALFGAAAGSAVFAMYVLGIALATDIRTFHFGATSGLSGEGNDKGSHTLEIRYSGNQCYLFSLNLSIC